MDLTSCVFQDYKQVLENSKKKKTEMHYYYIIVHYVQD